MYDSTTASVTSSLKSASPTFTDTTVSKILELATTTSGNTSAVKVDTATVSSTGTVTVAAGTTMAFLPTQADQNVAAPKNVPVVILTGTAGSQVTFNDGATTPGTAKTDRVVVGSAGADKIVIADAKNTLVTVGANDTVVAGGGHDTVVAGMGDSTVQGGTGHAIVQLGGNEADYKVIVQNGHAVVSGNGSTTDISKIQFVQLDNGKALVFANDSVEAAVTTLYQTTFGRTADATGLQFWFDQAKAGVSLEQIANAFTHSAEYNQGSVSDTAFLQGLYQNTFHRAADDAGLQYWADALEHGVSRAQVIAAFADVAGQSIAGTAAHVEATVVGSVTIVHNIV